MSEKTTHPYTWREYQKRLHRYARLRNTLGRFPLYGFYGGCAFILLVFFFFVGSWIINGLEHIAPRSSKKVITSKVELRQLGKQELQRLLVNRHIPPSPGTHTFSWRGRELTVETALDAQLQEYIDWLLARSKTYMAAVVVLRPDNGQVLAMVDYRSSGEVKGKNLTLEADFPAASLFKIVSAAAAVEGRGFTPEKPLFYWGRKHTLYKKQLKQKKTRYTRDVTFKRAFSGSINPVFGKIGIYDLGKDLMEEYADRFLFNHKIPFELPVDMSLIQVPEDAFGLAEISSGFNKETLISPFHAALITAGVANGGVIMEPWFVNRVTDAAGDVVYQTRPAALGSPIGKDTAKILRILMEDTVLYGTGRKTFRTLRRKKAFKGIALGAKTGTINDRMDQYKYDWITIFAIPGVREKAISLAVLAVHGEKLGIRAKDIGRLILLRHYRP